MVMSSKHALHFVIILGLALGGQFARAAEPGKMTVEEIGACMRANVVERGSLRDFQAVATDREGKSSALKVKVFWRPSQDDSDERMTLQVIEPEAEAGMAYLIDRAVDSERRMYVYLPALKRVQPVMGGEMTQKLWGTDFTISDLKQVQGLLLDGNARRLGNTAVSGRPAYVIETATDVEQTGYRLVRTYVDVETCTLLKAELFAEDDKPQKVLEADASTLIEITPYWVMLGYRMRDLLNGTHTDVTLSDVYLLEQLPDSLFTPEGFFLSQK
jgi:Outer membrane lipoprotein-sorting protein